MKMLVAVHSSTLPWSMPNCKLLQGKEEMLTSIPFARPQDSGPSVAIVTKVNRIQDQLVKKHDVELHMHLNRLEIAPQIYGMSVSAQLNCSSFSQPLYVHLNFVWFPDGGFGSCLAGNSPFRTCQWCGTPCLLTASLWTWWTTSLWPCCCTFEMLVRSICYYHMFCNMIYLTTKMRFNQLVLYCLKQKAVVLNVWRFKL